MHDTSDKISLCSRSGYKNAAPFMYPVDADLLGIPDYHQIVQRPMDLSTVSVRCAFGGGNFVGHLLNRDLKGHCISCCHSTSPQILRGDVGRPFENEALSGEANTMKRTVFVL